jgi:hypothetical protein
LGEPLLLASAVEVMFIVTIGAGLGSGAQRGRGSHQHPEVARSRGWSANRRLAERRCKELVIEALDIK